MFFPKDPRFEANAPTTGNYLIYVQNLADYTPIQAVQTRRNNGVFVDFGEYGPFPTTV